MGNYRNISNYMGREVGRMTHMRNYFGSSFLDSKDLRVCLEKEIRLANICRYLE